MIETGKNIVEAENLDRNLKKLSAQRELYSRAKSTLGWQVFFAIPVTLGLAVINLYLEIELERNIEWAVAAYAVILFILDSFIIDKSISQKKEKAAKIQELFDCEVLQIKWNKYLVEEKPDSEDIIKYHNLRLKRKKEDKLKNWYSEKIAVIENNVAKVICQRSNVMYDFSLRRKFMVWIIATGVASLIVLSIVALIKDLSFRSYLINAVTPFLPVFAIVTKQYQNNKRSIENLVSAKATIQQVWSEVIESDDKTDIPELAIRGIQDRIFLNRKDNALIPDSIYNRLRKGLEEQMYFSVDELILEYNENRK